MKIVIFGSTGHLAVALSCSWFEFAGKVFELAQAAVKMNAITTQQSQRRAVRPSYSH